MELSALKRVDIAKAQVALDERATSGFMAAHPHKREQPELKIVRGWEGYKPLLDEASSGVKARVEHFESERERLEGLIFKAVRDGDRPRAGKLKVQLGRTISSSSYTTQGYGATRYAQGAAEAVADQARFYNIPVLVTSETPSRATSARKNSPAHVGGWIACKNYRVIVEVEHAIIDPILIVLGPGPDLVEQVRLSWARGVNPRVFNPFLPPDFEAKHGLDYLGSRHG